MGRRVDVDLLVDAALITQRLHFKRVQMVHYFARADPAFPKPVFTPDAATGSRIWYWPDVVRWARGRGFWPAGESVGGESRRR